MKTNILNSGKRILGILLAVCILAVSLFTANVGVSINASAVVTVTDTWDGSVATSFSDTTHSGSSAEDAIVIANAEELAYLISGAGGGTTFGKYYTVAPNSVFDMQGLNGITLDSTLADVKSASPTGKNWSSNWLNSNNTFGGIFDGNGLVVFNVYGKQWASGLFPTITNTRVSGLAAQVKNVTVKNSWFESTAGAYTFGAAAIVGAVKNLYSGNPINISGCVVENCNIVGNAHSSDTTKSAALIIADIAWETVSIDNCLTLNNSLTFPSSATLKGGLIADTNTSVNISNTICIGTDPVATGIVDGSATYTNVYTDQESSTNGVTKLTTAQMTGTNAATNMSALDYSGTWFANTTTQPSLRVFHNFTTTNNNDGTHSEVCADCGLVGVPSNHFYNTIDSVNKISLCACGAYIDGIFDVWDSEGAIDSVFEGMGTEDDPYIINTVEELYGMVRSTGLDGDGNAYYYKVADGVSALYINDTRTMTQDVFASAGAAGSLMNWSTGYTNDTTLCGCGTTHKNACTNYFGGKFDGNGVAIYGLYSYSTYAYWAPGTGFVPMLTGDAIIKNVIFDTSYVKNTAGYIGVITASYGAWTAQYSSVTCDILSKLKLPSDCSATIINTVVRNAHLNTTYCPLDGETNAYVGGFISSCLEPKNINFVNCLYDGTNSTITTTATTADKFAGIYTTRQGYTTDSWVESCLVVNSASTTMDVVSATRWNSATTDFAYNSYAYGSTAANATLGTLKADGYTTVKAMPLLNWTAWDIDAVDTYGTPMPKLADGWELRSFRYYKDEVKNSDLYSYDSELLPYGSSKAYGNKGYEDGAFSDYDELVGAGTESDPYIIDSALMLFEIIASGGMILGVPQHYKLACDIDLGGIQWVCYQSERDITPKVYYIYNAFGGIIDGDGHTITGMFTATNDANAGFIPELTSTGVVKNLHFRNSYAYSTGNYGIIAGTAASGSVISGCSIDDSENAKFIGSGSANITNSIITVDDNTTYYLESGSTGTPTVDGVTWYQGGADGSKPQLVNKADTMPCADVDGDGYGYEYTANDLSALKQKLTRKAAYANVYGDVSRNGTTDIRDLVILQREVIGDDVVVLDGFWKNAKAGNISIYYDETDNYDSARKMELYLEEVTGVDIAKTMATTTANQTVRILNSSSLGANDYTVSYDLATCVVTITGGSFTAIEQGVLDFISGSNDVNGTVFVTETTGTIVTEKQPITVQTYSTSNDNGSTSNSSSKVNKGTYYYVWGDEFDEAVDGTISYDKWQIRDKGSDATVGTSTSGNFANLKLANSEGLKLLNVVDGGKLTMHRGVGNLSPENAGYNSEASYTTDSNTGERVAFDSGDMASNGLINSRDSLLFKYGYLEMQATVPNDTNAFPAWWLLSSAGNNNLDISRSLYSKVYPINDYYSDLRPIYFSSEDATSYEYQLPTYTYEIDIFEIINNGTVKNKLYYNLHKWYSYSKSTHLSTESFNIYDLNWNEINADNSAFSTLLLSTTYSGSEHTVNSASISYHANNIKTGQVNVAINEFGTNTASGTTYGKEDGADLEWWQTIFGQTKTDYSVNMITNISGTSVTYKFGFLWTDKEMTYILKDTSDNLVSSVTVDLADLDYDKNSNILPEQYVYFLIDNHFYTNGSTVTTAGDMTIDYVRLYQLDGARDIVTPETEAFNSNTRW